MRIITGTARGIKLDTLEGDTTRPTAERVKEALFSMIQFDIEGRRCLDLFAGSGQLGLEALSRGAEHCVFTDENKAAVEIIMTNAKKTKLYPSSRIANIGHRAFLTGASGKESFDIIFLDPPYNSGLLAESLSLIADGGLLNAGGRIVCESDNGELPASKKQIKSAEYNEEKVLCQVFGGDTELMAKFKTEKTALYGRTRITLLTL